MPSLRRTLSSPAVRSSPYPTSLSEQAAMLRSQGTGGHRRSTGSESIGRRVLADIEWWRVVDGQCLVSPDHDDEDVGRDERDTEQVPLHVAADRVQPPQYSEVDRSFVPFTWNPSLTEPSEAILSVVPTTPPRTRHGRDSSSSSLESTPELPETTIEGMRLDLEYLDLGTRDADSELPPYTAGRRARSGAVPAYLTIRAQTFADFLALQSDFQEVYADFTVSPLSSRSPAIFN
ncbi:hypothetical protein CPB85DRAFT_1247714 [Mucidula mucida]|nr:hypothetical protein CPB85DRAFT_1247714 [Mucidula mucida]